MQANSMLTPYFSIVSKDDFYKWSQYGNWSRYFKVSIWKSHCRMESL